jgi:hypothetical protein
LQSPPQTGDTLLAAITNWRLQIGKGAINCGNLPRPGEQVLSSTGSIAIGRFVLANIVAIR